MKVKLLVSRSGADGAQNRGDVIEVSADEAMRMAEAGQCELIRESPAETAVPKAKPEKAVK